MKKFLSVFALLLIGLCPAFAQMPSSGDVTSALIKLFGDNKAFTAKVKMKIEGPNPMTLVFDMAVLDGNVRNDMDFGKMDGNMPPEILGGMKMMGVEKMQTIVLSAAKRMNIIYPNLLAYVDMPLPEPMQTKDGDTAIQKTELGREEMDGHPCIKNKILFNAGAPTAQEFIVWNATDLKDFPIRVESSNAPVKMTSVFSDIKLSKPDAGMFNPPNGYTKYNSTQELMAEAMRKLMGGANP